MKLLIIFLNNIIRYIENPDGDFQFFGILLSLILVLGFGIIYLMGLEGRKFYDPPTGSTDFEGVMYEEEQTMKNNKR
jgi:hypothetical protein